MLPDTDALGGRLLSADELGKRLGTSRRWVYRMHEEHGLPAVQLGRSLLFQEAAAGAWLASKRAGDWSAIDSNVTTNGHVADGDEPREEKA